MDSHTSIISFLLLFFLSSMAVATPDMSREKRFLMGFGAFWPNIDSEAHLDSKDLGTGTDIDFESDLGLKDTDTLFTVFMAARISKRWRGEFEWFQLNRKKRTVIDEQIKWGDEVFDIGADIKSEFNLDLYRIGLNYSIVRKPRTVAGIGFGAHVTRFDAKLKAIDLGQHLQRGRQCDSPPALRRGQSPTKVLQQTGRHDSPGLFQDLTGRL